MNGRLKVVSVREVAVTGEWKTSGMTGALCKVLSIPHSIILHQTLLEATFLAGFPAHNSSVSCNTHTHLTNIYTQTVRE